MTTKARVFWWRLRYAFWAVVILRCKPSFAWGMANDAEPYDEMTPREALEEELSYWGE